MAKDVEAIDQEGIDAETAQGLDLSGFHLQNHEKVNRAIHGSMTSGGQLKGGVGEDAAPAAILAEYDRLGGLVLKNGRKVKTGSFYDFKGRRPRTNPEITLILKSISGGTVEVKAGQEIPIEAQAAEQEDARAKEGAKTKDKKVKPAKKGAKVADEDSE